MLIKMVKKKEEKVKEELGIAGSVLKGVGDLIPPLSGLIREATKTEIIKKRLKEVDEEVKKRLKGRPLKKSDLKIESGYSIRTILPEKKTKATKKIEPKKVKKKHLVDVFDEKDKVRVVTELRNVKSKDIRTKIKGKTLTITAKAKKRTIKLPCIVKKQIKKQYKNGILEIVFKK